MTSLERMSYLVDRDICNSSAHMHGEVKCCKS